MYFFMIFYFSYYFNVVLNYMYKILNLSNTLPEASPADNFWEHYGNIRNCSWWVVSPFATVFWTLFWRTYTSWFKGCTYYCSFVFICLVQFSCMLEKVNNFNMSPNVFFIANILYKFVNKLSYSYFHFEKVKIRHQIHCLILCSINMCPYSSDDVFKKGWALYLVHTLRALWEKENDKWDSFIIPNSSDL